MIEIEQETKTRICEALAEARALLRRAYIAARALESEIPSRAPNRLSEQIYNACVEARAVEARLPCTDSATKNSEEKQFFALGHGNAVA